MLFTTEHPERTEQNRTMRRTRALSEQERALYAEIAKHDECSNLFAHAVRIAGQAYNRAYYRLRRLERMGLVSVSRRGAPEPLVMRVISYQPKLLEEQ